VTATDVTQSSREPAAPAGSATFQAGAGAASIMPTAAMINNKLHPLMTVRLDVVGSPLEAKALAMRFGGETYLWVALDHISMSAEHMDVFRGRVSKATGIPMDRLVISCTHSHSTPFVESLAEPHPYFDYMIEQAIVAAKTALAGMRPAKIGMGQTNVVGASFNQRVHLPDGRAKYTRDWREGLASGRPIDPRLSVIRVDDEHGKPIAGVVRFAAHPACVIFNTPISGEYPGYMTRELTRTVAGGAPVLFAYGASGDVNCIPMFGTEADSKALGENLAKTAAAVFESVNTVVPSRFMADVQIVDLPLDPVPTIETLDREIAEIEKFIRDLDTDPTLEWALGVNCKKDWPAESKKKHMRPLGKWAEMMKEMILRKQPIARSWPFHLTTWVIDDVGLVFAGGEPLTRISLELAHRSPLKETLMISITNGQEGYLGTDEDKDRGGYEPYSGQRYGFVGDPTRRPLPFAYGASEFLIQRALRSIDRCIAVAAK
jgi:neutral ceramidase